MFRLIRVYPKAGETLRIGQIAAAHQVPLTPHLAHELSIQVVGALPNGFLVEFIDWIPPDLFAHALACAKRRA